MRMAIGERQPQNTVCDNLCDFDRALTEAHKSSATGRNAFIYQPLLVKLATQHDAAKQPNRQS